MIHQSSTDRLAHFCQRMATVTLFFIVSMLLLNAACWLYPKLNSVEAGYGVGFALTDRLISHINIDVASFPWWQKLGGIVLSSLPLLALTIGLHALYNLFKVYGRKEYFSANTAIYLGKIGRGVMLWTILDLLCEPLLSMWLTLREPEGQRLITLSFDSGHIVALFLSACIAVIARILHQANEVHSENQKFV